MIVMNGTLLIMSHNCYEWYAFSLLFIIVMNSTFINYQSMFEYIYKINYTIVHHYFTSSYFDIEYKPAIISTFNILRSTVP